VVERSDLQLAVLGSSPDLTTSSISFTVASPELKSPSASQIANWFVAGWLGFVRCVLFEVFVLLFDCLLCPTAGRE